MKIKHYLIIFLILLITLFSCQKNAPKSKSNEIINVKIDSVLNSVEKPTLKENKTPFTLSNSEVILLKSSIINKEYNIYIKLPKSYENSNKNYPILVLTDAGYAFPLVSSIYKRLFWANKIEEFIIIGISYSKGEHFGISRTRDYTPTYSPDEPNGYSKEAKLVSGQADKFIDFIEQELFPFLQDNYKVDMTKKAFAGHSFGGLLANYMVVSRPEVFDFYLSGSPSLWYHNKSILEKEKLYSNKHTDLKTNLFMCIGADEEIQSKFNMVSDMFELHNNLLSRNYKSLNFKSISIPGEDHETVYPTFITKGILWVFKKKKS